MNGIDYKVVDVTVSPHTQLDLEHPLPLSIRFDDVHHNAVYEFELESSLPELVIVDAVLPATLCLNSSHLGPPSLILSVFSGFDTGDSYCFHSLHTESGSVRLTHNASNQSVSASIMDGLVVFPPFSTFATFSADSSHQDLFFLSFLDGEQNETPNVKIWLNVSEHQHVLLKRPLLQIDAEALDGSLLSSLSIHVHSPNNSIQPDHNTFPQVLLLKGITLPAEISLQINSTGKVTVEGAVPGQYLLTLNSTSHSPATLEHNNSIVNLFPSQKKHIHVNLLPKQEEFSEHNSPLLSPLSSDPDQSSSSLIHLQFCTSLLDTAQCSLPFTPIRHTVFWISHHSLSQPRSTPTFFSVETDANGVAITPLLSSGQISVFFPSQIDLDQSTYSFSFEATGLPLFKTIPIQDRKPANPSSSTLQSSPISGKLLLNSTFLQSPSVQAPPVPLSHTRLELLTPDGLILSFSSDADGFFSTEPSYFPPTNVTARITLSPDSIVWNNLSWNKHPCSVTQTITPHSFQSVQLVMNCPPKTVGSVRGTVHLECPGHFPISVGLEGTVTIIDATLLHQKALSMAHVSSPSRDLFPLDSYFAFASNVTVDVVNGKFFVESISAGSYTYEFRTILANGLYVREVGSFLIEPEKTVLVTIQILNRLDEDGNELCSSVVVGKRFVECQTEDGPVQLSSDLIPKSSFGSVFIEDGSRVPQKKEIVSNSDGSFVAIVSPSRPVNISLDSSCKSPLVESNSGLSSAELQDRSNERIPSHQSRSNKPQSNVSALHSTSSQSISIHPIPTSVSSLLLPLNCQQLCPVNEKQSIISRSSMITLEVVVCLDCSGDGECEVDAPYFSLKTVELRTGHNQTLPAFEESEKPNKDTILRYSAPTNKTGVAVFDSIHPGTYSLFIGPFTSQKHFIFVSSITMNEGNDHLVLDLAVNDPDQCEQISAARADREMKKKLKEEKEQMEMREMEKKLFPPTNLVEPFVYGTVCFGCCGTGICERPAVGAEVLVKTDKNEKIPNTIIGGTTTDENGRFVLPVVLDPKGEFGAVETVRLSLLTQTSECVPRSIQTKTVVLRLQTQSTTTPDKAEVNFQFDCLSACTHRIDGLLYFETLFEKRSRYPSTEQSLLVPHFPIPNVTVHLFQDSALVDSDTTNGSGRFSFADNLSPTNEKCDYSVIIGPIPVADAPQVNNPYGSASLSQMKMPQSQLDSQTYSHLHSPLSANVNSSSSIFRVFEVSLCDDITAFLRVPVSKPTGTITGSILLQCLECGDEDFCQPAVTPSLNSLSTPPPTVIRAIKDVNPQTTVHAPNLSHRYVKGTHQTPNITILSSTSHHNILFSKQHSVGQPQSHPLVGSYGFEYASFGRSPLLSTLSDTENNSPLFSPRDEAQSTSILSLTLLDGNMKSLSTINISRFDEPFVFDELSEGIYYLNCTSIATESIILNYTMATNPTPLHTSPSTTTTQVLDCHSLFSHSFPQNHLLLVGPIFISPDTNQSPVTLSINIFDPNECLKQSPSFPCPDNTYFIPLPVVSDSSSNIINHDSQTCKRRIISPFTGEYICIDPSQVRPQPISPQKPSRTLLNEPKQKRRKVNPPKTRYELRKE
ncbi:hypothetical protein BLNAU_7350 [Blattamonas nauphoetae]|uniref:Uncharacterized protein n=1 Tax=Blattamonas nauphoetae TaxID=2049346 RepID=A0ABQ9Y1U1_9EUKA|nr:hypothetical protein BLNAU_7350 [Blattamonas nauphoetae]